MDPYEDYLNKSDKSKNDSDEEEDLQKLEVVKEFTLDFEKKLAKYIPPKIKFGTDLSNLSIITTVYLKEEEFISNLKLFMGYFILSTVKAIQFYDKTYELIFKKNLVENEEEILIFEILDEETLIVSASDKVRIIRFYEEKPKEIKMDIIQEISDTKYYIQNKILSNDLLLLVGLNKKYVFYQLEYYSTDQKFSANNKFKIYNEIEKVHNIYDDDTPGVIDLNNGRLFSWMNDDCNIKIIEYYPEVKIIKSKNGYQLHNAGLINDKYICLMGLTYPEYFTWLMDTETLEIVKTWKTPENDSFVKSISENIFIYSSESSIKVDSFEVENGNFVRKNISKRNYLQDGNEDWEESFRGFLVLDEKTFITCNYKGKIMVYQIK